MTITANGSISRPLTSAVSGRHQHPEVRFKRMTHPTGGRLLLPLSLRTQHHNCLRQLLHRRDVKLLFSSDRELVSKHRETHRGNCFKATAAGQWQECRYKQLSRVYGEIPSVRLKPAGWRLFLRHPLVTACVAAGEPRAARRSPRSTLSRGQLVVQARGRMEALLYF